MSVKTLSRPWQDIAAAAPTILETVKTQGQWCLGRGCQPHNDWAWLHQSWWRIARNTPGRAWET